MSLFTELYGRDQDGRVAVLNFSPEDKVSRLRIQDVEERPQSNSKSTNDRDQKFAIFLVQDMTTRKAAHTKIDDLPLEAVPILTESDVTSYSWKTHKIKLSKGAIEKLPKSVSLEGIPIVVVAAGERAYFGAFWSLLSSTAPDFPQIIIWADYLSINPAYSDHAEGDARENKEIYNVFKDRGKLIE